MSAWLVVGDDDLRTLLVNIGEEAGLHLSAVAPDDATDRLAAGETPDAMLIARGLVPLNVSPEQLGAVSRLAVASAGSRAEAEDGLSIGVFLSLPASLAEVEQTLRWLTWDGDQVARSSSSDASVDFA